MSWGGNVNDWTENLIRLWERGDMAAFRAEAGRIDTAWDEETLDAHGADLFSRMGAAATEAIEGGLRKMSVIDLGFSEGENKTAFVGPADARDGFGPQGTGQLDFIKGKKPVASLLESKGWGPGVLLRAGE